MQFVFTKHGQQAFLKLDHKDQLALREKIEFLKNTDQIHTHLKRVINMSAATHRLRIGSMRLILQKVDVELFYVLDV